MALDTGPWVIIREKHHEGERTWALELSLPNWLSHDSCVTGQIVHLGVTFVNLNNKTNADFVVMI